MEKPPGAGVRRHDALGGFESGFLSHAVGVPWAIAVGAIICAGAGLVTWWAVPRNPPIAAQR